METGDDKQICRLCLEIVPPGDAEPIGEKKKEILKVLLINDLHIIDNAIACNRCMEKVMSSFDFKSACFRVDNCISFVDADVPVDMKKIFKGEMRGRAMANVNLENRQICRLCMSLIEDKALDCNTALKDIIENCLPEVDIHRVHEPVVCELCFSRMKKLDEFMKTCQEIEQRINNYYLQAGVDHGIPLSVNLNDLKFKDYTISRLIKKESSNFGSNLLKDPKKEDTASIECEEIHIKVELDNIEEMGDSIPSESSKYSKKSGCLKRKRQIRQSASKGRNNFSSNDHMARRSGLIKAYGCQECTFETDKKHILVRHMVKHKDKSEVVMHKCENCEFETKYKRCIMRHMLRHRDPNVKRKFRCDKCLYETDFKSSLRTHNLIHKDKSEVEMHKCEHCEYETRYMSDVIRHMVKHRDPKARRKLKCVICPYETDFKWDFRKHSLTHKDKSEVEMQKCENCEYESRYKRGVIRHMAKHSNPRYKIEFEGDKCPYETEVTSNPPGHILKHNKRYDEILLEHSYSLEYAFTVLNY